ncbi:hypothetical protein VP01_8232g1 [Puccinia sorghi]|uniref:Uncharacterized protein n=1 Tax=Puccinia sorghi TaxID=27349 RepID=A0A0L6UAR7_9BASI|nr:hypothetical protein VP01_8232g1 [Puccinia sorghi]
MEIAEAQASQRKLLKYKEKEALLRKKEATKASKEIIKAAEDMAKAEARLIWTEETSLELLRFVKLVKEDHKEKVHLPGFTPFGKLFLAYSNAKGEFPLLAKLENETLLRRYQALMTKWQQVKDYTNTSGNGGFFKGILKFGLTKLLDKILNIHEDNAAAAALGIKNIDDDINQ